jgi:1-acyl-sn-glycerol-3-phosphate acyltransferase
MSFRDYRNLMPRLSTLRVLFWWGAVRWLCFLLFKLLYRLRSINRRGIPRAGAVIFVSNHQSHLDPILMGVHCGPFAPLARTTLFEIPVWGRALSSLGGIPLDRERSDVAAIRTAVDVLKTGGRVMIFPEGTRSRDGAVGPFRPGMLVLVRRTKATVVPIAVEGAFDAWPPGFGRPKFGGRIAVTTGDPITADQLLADGRDAALDMLRRRIEQMRLELRSEIRARSRGRYPAPGPADEPFWKLPGSDQPQHLDARPDHEKDERHADPTDGQDVGEPDAGEGAQDRGRREERRKQEAVAKGQAEALPGAVGQR